jgi:phenylalanyl-tRNA synthetase beta chain
MKFSLSWLKEHLETEADIHAVADCLNRIGLEVEGIENPADALAAFRIAKVLKANPHPQADKLQVLIVDAGDGPVQVVCGAPNARTGMTGIFGPAGAIVPSNGMELKVTAIRGEMSNGMMCSLTELALGEDHDGIAELPDDAPKGESYAQWVGLNDPIIDVAITPNRQDCMGVYGIARDLAAAGLGTLKPLKAPIVAGTFACPIEIRTDDTDGCPAFYGRVIKGVTNGVSPDWMQKRLKSAGQKPISALVDITNYVMLDHGRPSHAYDLAKLTGAVVARRAKDGEQVMALNDKPYTLTSEMTVIADDNSVHDIAGIMGGTHSGCSDTMTDVLLEIAYFNPERIAKTGQALMLTSDARSRFERGVDPGFMGYGLELISSLILEICGGVASEVVKAGEAPLTPRSIAYDTAYCAALGGVEVDAEKQKAILSSLGFGVGMDWAVTIPTWRRDIDGPADLVEEVVRIVGIDNIPSTPLPRAEGVATPTATPMQKLERKMRRSAAARGLNEAINWSFLPEKEAAAFGGGAWTLANPISEDMKVMRPSLLPGLLSAARRNIDRGASSVRLFELGRRYFKAADGSSDERLTLGLLLVGDKTPRSWSSGKAAKFDAYDAKAEVMALLAAAGVATEALMVMQEAGDHYHPGQSATLRMGPKNILASFGALHPVTSKTFDLDGAVVAAEIYLDAIPLKKASGFMRPAYTPPALQAVTRDFAFLVAADLPSSDLVRAIKGSDKGNIVAVRLFDQFLGQGVPEGQKSLAVEVTMQPGEKSYTQDDLLQITKRISDAAHKLGGKLRFDLNAEGG